MVGAHLDSWHRHGRHRQRHGAATVMEAMRILKTLNIKPRRTIRAALWRRRTRPARLEGLRRAASRRRQEQGARDKFSVYQLDNGYPPISGFYMESKRSGAGDHDRMA